MNQPAVIQKEPEAPAPSEAGAVIQLIERASKDPNVDIEKMRELLTMRREMMAFEAERNFDEAMAEAQAEMRPVAVDASNPQTRSRYASYHALDGAIRPVYSKYGFALSFDTADGAPEGCIRIVCRVARGGHRTFPHIDMPADGKGAKGGDVMTKTHATGAAISYGKRYLLGMIFNIAISQDDDGNGAVGANGEPKLIDAPQFQHLQQLIEDTKSDEGKLLAYLKADDLHTLTQAQYRTAVSAMKKKGAK